METDTVADTDVDTVAAGTDRRPGDSPPDVVAMPDTTAEAVWSYLQEADYDDVWALWPDMGELYEGGRPHGRLLTTYVNAAALSAIEGSESQMPTDALIVKENHATDSTLVAVTAMYEVEGYDPEHADWFWARYQPDGSVDAAGRVSSCQECHVDGADYVLTDDFGMPGGGG